MFADPSTPQRALEGRMGVLLGPYDWRPELVCPHGLAFAPVGASHAPKNWELYTKVTKTSLTASSLCYNILLDQEDMTWQTRPQASISEKVSP